MSALSTFINITMLSKVVLLTSAYKFSGTNNLDIQLGDSALKRVVTYFSAMDPCPNEVCRTFGDDNPQFSKNISASYCSVATGYQSYIKAFATAMLKSPALQKRTGIHFRAINDPFQADIVLCDSDGVSKFIEDPNRKANQSILVTEGWDDNAVALSEHLLSSGEVLAVVKPHTFKSTFFRCKGNYWIPLFLKELKQKSSNLAPTPTSIDETEVRSIMEGTNCPSMSPELKKKVFPVVPTWLVSHSEAFAKHIFHAKPIASRSIDVAFMGKWYVDNHDWAGPHREQLVSLLPEIATRNGWKLVLHQEVSLNAYEEQMLDAKVFISPFGLGEWSGKDEETIFFGSILIKPMCGQFEHVVPIYKANVTCFDVRPDWSNLELVLKAALSDVARLQEMQTKSWQAISPWIDPLHATQHPEIIQGFADMLSP